MVFDPLIAVWFLAGAPSIIVGPKAKVPS